MTRSNREVYPRDAPWGRRGGARRWGHVLAAVLATGTAAAQEVSPDEALATWLETARDGRGHRCVLSGRHEAGERLWLACGAAGVWWVAREGDGFRLEEAFALDGEAAGFVEEPGGPVWVKVRSMEARPLETVIAAARPSSPHSPTAAPAAPDAAPAAPRPAVKPHPAVRVGRVLRVEGRDVVISLGSREQIAPDMHIELSRRREERLAPDESAVARDVLAVGKVTSVSEGHARVRVGLNEQVPVGAFAEPTRSPVTSSLSAPPRVGEVWSAQAMARPFVAIGELGGGVLLNAAIGYRFASNWHVQALIDPVGIADVEGGDSVTTALGLAMASYDTAFLGIGAGFGAQTVNAPAFGLGRGSGLAFGQSIRIGAVDGLNLSARTSIVLFHREFDLGALDIHGQIPIGGGYWLTLGGGGGNAGYAFGQFGLRALLEGNGGPGSTFLTAVAGGAGLFEDQVCEEVNGFFECRGGRFYAGPMVGAGIEWRL
jgi:hypothetical protein